MVDDKLIILMNQLMETFAKTDSSSRLENYFVLEMRFDDILNLAQKQIPDSEYFIQTIKRRSSVFRVNEAKQCFDYILELLEIEKQISVDIENGNIFQGARDKLNEAIIYYRNEDYIGTLNSSNTCLELLLKEKFRIPTTIRGINTAKIIELAIKYELGPTKFFEQARKHVTDIDNKIKHVGYTPSKSDTIHAIKSMEELSKELENHSIDLTDEIINKIYSGI